MRYDSLFDTPRLHDWREKIQILKFENIINEV